MGAAITILGIVQIDKAAKIRKNFDYEKELKVKAWTGESDFQDPEPLVGMSDLDKYGSCVRLKGQSLVNLTLELRDNSRMIQSIIPDESLLTK